MTRTLLAVACGLLCLSLLFGTGPSAAQNGKSKPDQTSKKKGVSTKSPRKEHPILVGVDETDEIRQAMQKKVSVKFKSTPLNEVIAHLAKEAKVNMIVDTAALKEDGLAADKPIDFASKEVTVEHLLDRVLKPLECTWHIEDEVVKITTEIAIGVSWQMHVRMYRITRLLDVMKSESMDTVSAIPAADDLQFIQFGDLPGVNPAAPGIPQKSPRPKSNLPREIEALLDTIMSTTRGPWFDIDSEGGTIKPVADLLVVRQTLAVHDEVEALLEALTAIATKRALATALRIRAKTDDGRAERKARAGLSKKISLDYKEIALDDMLADLSKRTGIEFVIDEVALKEEDIATDASISINVKDVTLRSALNLVFQPLRLALGFRHGVMVVTSTFATEYEKWRTLTVYAVGDILDSGGIDADSLMNLLMTETSALWLELDLEGGTIKMPFRQALVVRQTRKAHAEVAARLAQLRLGLAKRKAKPLIDPDEFVMRTYVWTRVTKNGDELAMAIKTFVAPKSWNDADKTAVILEVGDQLIIRQTRKTHRKIEDFVTSLHPRADPPQQAKDTAKRKKRPDKKEALIQELQVLRSQIELYKFQHRGQPPTADFKDAMLLASDPDGKTGPIGTKPLGPYYIGQLPANPYNGKRSVKVVVDTNTLPPSDGTTGWIYSSKRGRIKANIPRTLTRQDGTALEDL